MIANPNKLTAFDFEIVNPRLPERLPDGADLWDYAPHYISVAGVWVLLNGNTDNYAICPMVGGRAAACFDERATHEVLDKLLVAQEQGYAIVSWNGAGFDFRVLAELLPARKHEVVELCKKSYDPMFQILCLRGFMVGLGAVCKGFGLGEKKMHGQSALVWPNNAVQIIEYVKDDASKTGRVLLKILEHSGLRWVTKKGMWSFQAFYRGPLTVEECLAIPLPDTSWMDNPKSREDVLQWWK